MQELLWYRLDTMQSWDFKIRLQYVLQRSLGWWVVGKETNYALVVYITHAMFCAQPWRDMEFEAKLKFKAKIVSVPK